MKRLRALPGRVILQFPKPMEETKGGIIIPEKYQQIPKDEATVVDVGPAITEEETIFSKMVRAGSTVKANPSWGIRHQTTINGEEVEYRIYRVSEIVGLLEEE